MHPLLADAKYVLLEIDKIRIIDGNPMTHSSEQLDMIEASFEKFGIINPVIVTSNHDLVAGAARLSVARRNGMTLINAVVVSHLTEADVRAYRIADNQLARKGAWSFELLGKELELISSLDLNFEPISLGFETGEIDQMILAASAAGSGDPPPAIPDPDRSTPPVCVAGDIFSIGHNKIACGDGADREFVATVLAGQLADVVITDQPWNLKASFISGKGRKKHQDFCMAGGEMTPKEFRAFTERALEVQSEFVKPGGLIFEFIDWRTLDLMIETGKEKIGPLVNICVWVKPKAGMGAPWRSQHEMVPVFCKEGGKPANNIQLGRFGRNRSNVWEFASPTGWGSERYKLDIHPTTKNEEMIAEAILDCTDRNGLVLDPFLGSGTTALAAHATGRICFGFDLDPHYAELSIRRLVEVTGQEAIHQNGKRFEELREERVSKKDRTDD